LTGIVALNMVFAVAVEAGVLIALGRFGYTVGNGGMPGIAIATVIVLTTAGLWHRFAAPKAPERLAMPALLAFKSTVFAGAFVALCATGDLLLAIGFAVATLAHLGVALRSGTL